VKLSRAAHLTLDFESKGVNELSKTTFQSARYPPRHVVVGIVAERDLDGVVDDEAVGRVASVKDVDYVSMSARLA